MDISLLYKLCELELSSKEEKEIQHWLQKDVRRQMYMNRFIEREQGKTYHLSVSKMERYRTDFIQRLRSRRQKQTHKKLWRAACGTAAAMILALFTFYHLYDKEETKPIIAELTNTPLLEYEDCSEDLKLPKESTGKVTMDKSTGGMREITVGRGAEFKIRLNDGTVVWLNSDTQLSYSEQFNDTERKVILEGEAYFAVAKDRKRPFIVDAKGVSIKVYGTEFNVTAREKAVRTTLVNGSVSVRLKGERQETILTPGLTAEVHPETHRLNVCQRNTDLYAGWKEGKFTFEDTPLEELLAEVALWYDLQVDFESPEAGKECFTGSLSRHMPLVDLLRVLQSTTYVSFHLQERKLTVGKSRQND